MKLKRICCKCGLKPNFLQKSIGLYEWWKYKDGKIYCDDCAPKGSRVAFIGLFIQYITNKQ